MNPYGVAFVPAGFLTGGVLNPGDVLVSNFNNSKNTQGTGTTIVRVTPDDQTSVFYPPVLPGVVGLSTALGVLKAGYVLVGNVPSTDGTNGTVGMGSIMVLDKNGNFVTNLDSNPDPNMLNGPWDMTINDMGSSAQVFVSNVLSGTVSRFDVSLANGGFQVTSATQIASGYTHRGDTAAFELGPTGLAYNPATNTLYVASTADNAIYAVPNAGSAGTQSGTGKVVYKDRAHLHGPLGLTFAPDGNLIAAQGDAINGNKRQRASWSSSHRKASSSASSRSARRPAARSGSPPRLTCSISLPSTISPTRSRSGRSPIRNGDRAISRIREVIRVPIPGTLETPLHRRA